MSLILAKLRKSLFKKSVWMVIVFGLVLSFTLTACSSKITSVNDVPRTSPAAVYNAMQSGANIIVIDARPTSEYNQEHITGAVSIPEADIADHASQLKQYDEIITYCT